MKKVLFSSLIILIVGFVLWYFMLPPLNLSSPEFWVYFYIMLTIILCFSIPFKMVDINKGRNIIAPKWLTFVLLGAISIIVIILIINLANSPLFNANRYANRIVVDESKNFVESVALVDFNKIPLLDKDSSQKLGDRKMGQATEWVSQYYVSNKYTQINFNDSILRVTPIEYAGFIKYMINRKEGIKGFITVNSVNGEANLVKINKGMKYMPSAYFFENLNRKLRISYPTKIFDRPVFEIDNENNPYWVTPVISYSGVGVKKEINEVVILDAVTGESKLYNVKDVPTWVDHVYESELIIEQLNNWGEYKNGFWNSIFGQKNVVNTTEGYNYLVMNDDVYLYTGITSVSSDESNLGFVLVNLRTKETSYYSVPGAEEYSAMASAEGLVQEKKYTASFPLLINLNNKPTYLLSLKDDAGLVKMYAFVDVSDYQKVIVNDASLGIEAAAKKYLGESLLDINESLSKEKDITVKSITTAVIDANTYYYIVDIDNNLYSASIKIDKNYLPFVKNGDKLSIKYSEGVINNIISFEVKK